MKYYCDYCDAFVSHGSVCDHSSPALSVAPAIHTASPCISCFSLKVEDNITTATDILMHFTHTGKKYDASLPLYQLLERLIAPLTRICAALTIHAMLRLLPQYQGWVPPHRRAGQAVPSMPFPGASAGVAGPSVMPPAGLPMPPPGLPMPPAGIAPPPGMALPPGMAPQHV